MPPRRPAEKPRKRSVLLLLLLLAVLVANLGMSGRELVRAAAEGAIHFPATRGGALVDWDNDRFGFLIAVTLHGWNVVTVLVLFGFTIRWTIRNGRRFGP